MAKLLLSIVTLSLMCLGTYATTTVINEGKFILETSVDGDNLRVKAVVETLGYVGFGISPGGSMVGADIVIVGVNSTSGESYIGDYYGTGNTRPTFDEVQNVQLVSANENATHTSVEFLRPIISTDVFQDVSISSGIQQVIWAIGLNDSIQYHGTTERGTVELILLEE